MAILDPLINSANSLQPAVMIVNKLINKIVFKIYFSLGFTCPTLFHLCISLGVHNINVSITTTVITDGFIRHYKSSVYPLWSPCLGNKYSFFSFLFLLSLHNMHCLLDVSFLVFLFFLSWVLDDNEK